MKFIVVSLLLFSSVSHAQKRVDPRNTYSRLIVVVPMTGAGTATDPKRPMYAPAPRASPTSPQPAIIAYSFQTSDDGKLALAEFVARPGDRAAFAPILADKTLKVFVKGKDKKGDIEAELRKYKKDFSLEKFGLVMP